MKKWIVYYTSSQDDDCCKCWCEANTKEDAISYVKREYWDVKEIIEIREMK